MAADIARAPSISDYLNSPQPSLSQQDPPAALQDAIEANERELAPVTVKSEPTPEQGAQEDSAAQPMGDDTSGSHHVPQHLPQPDYSAELETFPRFRPSITTGAILPPNIAANLSNGFGIAEPMMRPSMQDPDSMFGMANMPMLTSNPLMGGSRLLNKCESLGETPSRSMISGVSRAGLRDALPLGHGGGVYPLGPYDHSSRSSSFTHHPGSLPRMVGEFDFNNPAAVQEYMAMRQHAAHVMPPQQFVMPVGATASAMDMHTAMYARQFGIPGYPQMYHPDMMLPVPAYEPPMPREVRIIKASQPGAMSGLSDTLPTPAPSNGLPTPAASTGGGSLGSGAAPGDGGRHPRRSPRVQKLVESGRVPNNQELLDSAIDDDEEDEEQEDDDTSGSGASGSGSNARGRRGSNLRGNHSITTSTGPSVGPAHLSSSPPVSSGVLPPVSQQVLCSNGLSLPGFAPGPDLDRDTVNTGVVNLAGHMAGGNTEGAKKQNGGRRRPVDDMDPEAPGLQDVERKKIRRESAKRVRDKRDGDIDAYTDKVKELQMQHQLLEADLQSISRAAGHMHATLAFAKGNCQKASHIQQQLRQQHAELVLKLQELEAVGSGKGHSSRPHEGDSH